MYTQAMDTMGKDRDDVPKAVRSAYDRSLGTLERLAHGLFGLRAVVLAQPRVLGGRPALSPCALATHPAMFLHRPDCNAQRLGHDGRRDRRYLNLGDLLGCKSAGHGPNRVKPVNRSKRK